MSDNVRIIKLEALGSDKPKGWHDWMGYGAWDGKEMYIPSEAIKLEGGIAMILTAFDNVTIVRCEKRVLIPESWAKKEQPASIVLIDKIVETLKRVMVS